MVDDKVHGWHQAMRQLQYLSYELHLLTSRKPIRWLVVFFEPGAWVLVSYRFDRCLFLLCGTAWTALRILAFPFFLFFRLMGCRHELCFKADIGRGLQLAHPTLGLVAHGDAIVGENCTLCGGNSIGVRRKIHRGELVIGNDVFLGINSCILGPAHIGNRVTIGAGAVVVSDLPDGCMAVGVPAKPTPAKIQEGHGSH